MIVARENLTALLNMDLELEMAGAIQYINHAAMLTGVACDNIIAALRVYTYEKIEHAMILADQINYLGGFPSLRVGSVHSSDENEEMLLFDFEDAEDAIRRYKIRIAQADQLQEMALSNQLRTILAEEQRQAMYLKKLVCAGARKTEDSALAPMDPCDFSQVWAERAARVPVRIKKEK